MKRKVKRPKKKASRTVKKRPSLVQRNTNWQPIYGTKPADGAEVITPIDEVIYQLLVQYGVAASSDEPAVRVIGRRQLRKVAEHLAATSADQFFRTVANRDNAKQPRKRAPSLQVYAMQCVLARCPGITAGSLCEKLEADPLTLERDDIQLRLDGENIVIRYFPPRGAEERATIKKTSLPSYLARARNS